MMASMRLGVLHFMMASAFVLLAFTLCEGMQWTRSMFLPHVAGQVHPLFLPFGVMVLLTWVYGGLAFPMMLPAAFVAVGMFYGVAALTGTVIAVLTVKVAAVPLGFALFRRAGWDARGEGGAANWRVLVAVGLVASLLGNVPRVMAGPCCDGFSAADRIETFVTVTAADMAGLIVVLLAAMAVFRMLRQA